MIAYIIRRVLYAIPILIGVNLITFVLFFFVNTPDHMARQHIDPRRQTPEEIAKWKRNHNYHLPYFFNTGWTEIDLRQIKSETLEFDYVAKPGAYRIQLEVPKPGKGEIEVSVTTDETGRVSGTAGGKAALDSAAPGRYDVNLASTKGTHHPLKVKLTLSPDSPSVLARVYFKEDLSFIGRFTQTVFWKKSVKYLFFQFGDADDGRNIGTEIGKRIGPSLAIQVPNFLLGILLNVIIAMIIAFYRGTYLDFWGVVGCVILMSVSVLFYVIGGQYFMGKVLRLVPISGYDGGIHSLKFIILPVAIGIIGGVGSGVRWYRTIFLEEIGKDYVRTARSKGLPESIVLYKHALKNAMIPILTGIVVVIPFLFIGSLILESFFAVPGMGNFMIEAIQRQDFSIVQAMVFLGSVLFVIGLIMTDISYTLVDPRVRLQ